MKKKLTVVLASVGNPDFGQDPNRPLYGCLPNRKLKVANLEEAKQVCMDFIEYNDLGSGNWSGGEVFDETKKEVAYVSYGGRVFRDCNCDIVITDLKTI